MIRWVLCASALLAAGATDDKKAPPPAAAKAPTDGRTTVDWQDQVLKATGSGAPDMRATSPAQARLGAEKAAQLDAFRNLLGQAKGIRVSASQTVGDRMVTEEIRARVEGVIKGYRVVKKRYFSDQGVELDVEVPLASISLALFPAPADAPTPAGNPGGDRHTGVVVDVRGLGVQPALAPRLLDEAGRLLYGLEVLSDAARKTTGAAGWFKSMDAATRARAVGDAPLVLKAARAQGSDLILAAAEARALGELAPAVLQEGRVAIVYN
ncbi:MAG TPA: hypothetical protein VEJ89_07965 [Myxococcaceae bacterium]|nr:hypothetical protein [Myxococcaceae bacterium]